MQINIEQLMTSTGVKFGTSGVRGLVVDMSDQVCWTYVTAFLQYLMSENLIKKGDRVGIAGDLRASSDKIMAAAVVAVQEQGLVAINYGKIPSPAIAHFGITEAIPTIMVTGSHIPDDRNGIKFNKADGEILKADELAICSQLITIPDDKFNDDGSFIVESILPATQSEAEALYIERFTNFFPEQCLQGMQIGLYEHSSVSRDVLKTILTTLGATVTSLARSDQFISVDTEAIRPEDVILAKQWAAEYQFDCIISTDGDGDRPLISDEHGNWLRGDIAGVLCAQYLNAKVVVTPVSSNSAVEKSALFEQVIRTRIGSPYVITAMDNAADGGHRQIIGYEANGGVLQGSDITLNDRLLTALPTRDAAIVPLSILMLAKQQSLTVSELLKTLPARFTFSDRLKAFPTELSQQRLAVFLTADQSENFSKVQAQFSFAGQVLSIDDTDGIRITFDTQEVIHLRPSGNAPELRCYTEAADEERAQQLNQQAIEVMNSWRA